MFFADKPERYAGAIGTGGHAAHCLPAKWEIDPGARCMHDVLGVCACADYFATNRLFYSNSTGSWLGAPNAALFGLRNNQGKNNTVRWGAGPCTCTAAHLHDSCGLLQAALHPRGG